MKKWAKIATTALIGTMIGNLALAAGYFLQKRHYDHARQHPQLAGEKRMSPISGITVNDSPWQSKTSACHVVRITDDGCQYCKKDKPNYDRLVEMASQSNCEVIEIAPQAGRLGEDTRPGIVQMKFVAAGLGPAVYPFATPQTVILDRNWKVTYSRRGVFSKDTLDDAIGEMQRLAKRTDK